MNARNAKTGMVHDAWIDVDGNTVPQCGQGSTAGYEACEADVTCKRCVKIVERRDAERRSMAFAPSLLKSAMPTAYAEDTTTNELPNDAERAFQADEDAATYAEILAEQDTDDIDDMIFERDQAALEAMLSDTSWMTDPVIISEAGLTRLMKALDHDVRVRAARRRRSKPSKQSRRPSRQR